MATPLTCAVCGRVTLRVSWSSLKVHDECKQKSFRQRTGNRASMADRRVFFPGNVTDRVVRDWLLEGPEPGSMPSMVERIMDREFQVAHDEGGKILWKNKDDRADVLRDCTTAVTKIEPLLVKYVLPFDYQADYSFRAPLEVPHPNGGYERITLIGKMDIIVRDGDGRYSVFDVKHTKDNGYWRKTIGQLSFYDFAVQIMFEQPTRITALFQPLCDEIVMPMQSSDQSRGELMQRVAGMARDIWTDDNTPRSDTKFCFNCDVKHVCSKFTPVGKRLQW